MYIVTTLPIPINNVQGSVAIEQQGHELWLLGSRSHKFGHHDVVLVILIEEIYCDRPEEGPSPFHKSEVYHSLVFTCFLDGLLVDVQLCSIVQGVCYFLTVGMLYILSVPFVRRDHHVHGSWSRSLCVLWLFFILPLTAQKTSSEQIQCIYLEPSVLCCGDPAQESVLARVTKMTSCDSL